MPNSEMVTVADAARRLGVDARQVRRFMDRLQPGDIATDPLRTHKGQPVTIVRWVSLEAVARPDSPSEYQETSAKDTADKPADVQETVKGPSFAELAEAQRRAEVAETRAAALSEALEREKQATAREAALLDAEREAHREARVLHQNTQGELQNLRTRAQELEAANLRLIEVMPIAPADTQETPRERAESPESDRNAEQVQADTPAMQETPKAWWQFWR